jgi:hypothetical protein
MHQENRVPDDYSPQEMRELKRECDRLTDTVCWLPDLHRAVVAQRNNWSYSSGRADVNQVESWQREWEEYILSNVRDHRCSPEASATNKKDSEL